jgi:hypothetical protein
MTMDVKNAIRPDLEVLPLRMRSLAIDDRGYPVPWFVAWVDGKPEFRMADQDKLAMAVRQRLCWVCGEQLGRTMTFVAGPMCGINRTSAEPPSHHECAQWSARNCPFLSNAKVRRREDAQINNETLVASAPGLALTRNPGVCLLWPTRHYSRWSPGNGGLLFELGDPSGPLEFWANGRRATRAEIDRSIETGIPKLAELAEAEGEEAVWALAKMRAAFEQMLPAE